VPYNIQELQEQARADVPILEDLLREGDIVFRLSNARVINNKVSFSKLIADLCDSDFSHTSLVYKVTDFGVILADIGIFGIERRFLNDWYIDETQNVVIKRLKPEYQHYLPEVMEELCYLIREDVLYDEHFIAGDDKYYCTELVDHCFRHAGLSLADHVAIKDLPSYGFIHALAGLVANVDVNSKVVVAGNDQIGLFSSKYLDTVIDLRLMH